jgi:uncharacterized repeat protein (TIGR02543 family)
VKKILLILLFIIGCTTDGLEIYEPDLIGPPSFTLSFTAGSGGSVSSPGSVYEVGSEVTITATPVSGYIFSGWSNGSSENPLTVIVNSNISINATFTPIPLFNVTLTANSGGSVSGGGSYQEGTQVTLYASPISGYTFSSWSDGSTDSNKTITITENITLTANFVETVYTYTLSVESGNGGSVSTTGGVYNEGTQVNITATPSSGYSFNTWSNGSTDNPTTVTINSDLTLTANFDATPSYNITLNGNSGGLVSGGGSYQQGTQVNLSATPNTGYLFSSWSDGSTEQSRTITVSQNLTLSANFEIISSGTTSYSINISANTGGSVSGGGSYDEGTQLTLTATPNSGYTFSSWSDGSTEQSRTITVSQDLTLTANFDATPSYNITLNGNSGGSVSGGGSYQQGTQVNLTATPSTGYLFSSWSDGSTEQSRTITVSQNLILSANFSATANLNSSLGNFQIGSLEFYNGNLYVGTHNKILKIDSAGNIYTYLGAGGEIDIDIDIAGESDFITGLVFDNNGALYFGGDRTLRKLVGSQITTIYSNGVSTGGIVVNSNNDIFIPMCCANKTMRKVDQSGNVSLFSTLGGSVYGSDIKNDIIYMAYSTGEIKTISSTNPSSPGGLHTVSSVVDFLTSIKIDQNGNLYILNSSNSQNGKLIKVVNGSETLLINDLWSTRGLDFDDNGNLYVGDMGRIHKVSPEGTVSVFINTRQ